MAHGVSSIPPRTDVQASRGERSAMAHGVGFAPLPVDRYRPVGRFGASRRARTRGRIRCRAGRLRPPPPGSRGRWWFWSPDPAWHLRCHWRLWLGAGGGPRTSPQHQSVCSSPPPPRDRPPATPQQAVTVPAVFRSRSSAVVNGARPSMDAWRFTGTGSRAGRMYSHLLAERQRRIGD